MKCYFKMNLFSLITLAAILFPVAGSNLAGAAFLQEEEEEPGYTEEEYNDYVKATETQAPLDRGTMLMEFIGKYPKSILLKPYVEPAYRSLMYECVTDKKFEELEKLSEKWLATHPDSLETITLAAAAAFQLKKDEKYLECMTKLYGMEPTADRAVAIAQFYDDKGNLEKYAEWCEKIFTYPEYSVDYTLRFGLVRKYLETDLIKSGKYAQQTLKILDSAAAPDAAGRETIRTIRRYCNQIIGLNLFEAGKFQTAIESFDKALKAEKYQEGFYYIGKCYHSLGDPEMAHDYYAAAEIMGGDLTEKSKEYKEQLYKPLHNDSLIGIDKVHKRAQAILDQYPNPVRNTKNEADAEPISTAFTRK